MNNTHKVFDTTLKTGYSQPKKSVLHYGFLENSTMNESINTFFTLPPGPLREQFWTEPIQQLAKQMGFNVRLNPHESSLSDKEWADIFADTEALITSWGAPQLNSAILSKNTKLKIIGHAAGSVRSIISPELYSRGVKIVTANWEMARVVAEWCLMMTLVATRRLLECAQFGTHNPLDWANRDTGMSCDNSVIGIWGFGDISRHLVHLLNEFHPKEIIVHSGHLTERQADDYGVRRVEFNELFATADVIHLLAGLTNNNRGRVGREQLALIKDGACLVNAGRAALAQREPLLEELQKARFNAIFDVHYEEPLPDNSSFRGLQNVIMTPHNAGNGRRDSYVKCVLEEFGRFFKGQKLQHEISLERAKTMTDESLID